MDIPLKEKNYPPLDLVAPIIFAVVFFATLIYSRLEPNVEDVDMNYVITHKDLPGYVLLDVRDKEIYDGKAPFASMEVPYFEGVPGGHIPGAINFPISELNIFTANAALAKIGVTKDHIIIVYCNNGSQSGRFVDYLIRRFNFSPSKLKNYRGSIKDWSSNPNNILLPKNHDGPYYSPQYKNNVERSVNLIGK